MITARMKVWGEFTLQRRSAGGILLEEKRFRNLITNTGLDQIGLQNSYFSYCRLSTSTATPTVTDTAMGGTSVATATASPVFVDSNSISGSAPYTATALRGFRFAAGVATGTWSSIGIQPDASDTNTICKTRIRDGGGTPTSITVLAGEILDVRYEFRTEIDTADVTGSISGVGFTMRPYGVTYSSTRALSVLTSPSVTIFAEYGGTIALPALTATSPFVNGDAFSNGTQTATYSAYISGTYTRSWSVVFPTTATHPSNTIRGIQVNNVGIFGLGWAFLLNAPGFSKTSLQTCTITGSISWGRA